MSKKKVNKRAKPGSGVKHDKHAPKAKADIAASEDAADDTKSGENESSDSDSDNENAE